MHLLSALSPPKGVIRQIDNILAKFFWRNKTESRSKHWVKWDDLCIPKLEGGLGFRSMTDTTNALYFNYG